MLCLFLLHHILQTFPANVAFQTIPVSSIAFLKGLIFPFMVILEIGVWGWGTAGFVLAFCRQLCLKRFSTILSFQDTNNLCCLSCPPIYMFSDFLIFKHVLDRQASQQINENVPISDLPK